MGADRLTSSGDLEQPWRSLHGGGRLDPEDVDQQRWSDVEDAHRRPARVQPEVSPVSQQHPLGDVVGRDATTHALADPDPKGPRLPQL
jgi:hypothetical protein